MLIRFMKSDRVGSQSIEYQYVVEAHEVSYMNQGPKRAVIRTETHVYDLEGEDARDAWHQACGHWADDQRERGR